MTTSTPRADPVRHMAARFAIFGLVGVALWANVYRMERPAAAQGEPPQDIYMTATPALPSPALAPVVDLAQPTPEPAALAQAQQLPAPQWTAEQLAPVAVADAPAALPEPSTSYLENVGAQADHSPRGNVDEPPPAQTGPILMPASDGQPAYIVAPVGAVVPDAMAAAVPPISAAQAEVIGARTSNGCAMGQVFFPRTGCHTPGSGGPQPGAVSER
jgi:hypothetical protein